MAAPLFYDKQPRVKCKIGVQSYSYKLCSFLLQKSFEFYSLIGSATSLRLRGVEILKFEKRAIEKMS